MRENIQLHVGVGDMWENFQLHTGIEDVREKLRIMHSDEDMWRKLLITHGETGVLEPQHGCGVNIKHTRKKEEMHFSYRSGNDKKG